MQMLQQFKIIRYWQESYLQGVLFGKLYKLQTIIFYIGYFAIAVIKQCDQDNLWKEGFTGGLHGSRHS